MIVPQIKDSAFQTQSMRSTAFILAAHPGVEEKSLYYLGYFDNHFWPALSTTVTFIMQKAMSEEVPNSVWQRATTSTWELDIVLW